MRDGRHVMVTVAASHEGKDTSLVVRRRILHMGAFILIQRLST